MSKMGKSAYEILRWLGTYDTPDPKVEAEARLRLGLGGPLGLDEPLLFRYDTFRQAWAVFAEKLGELTWVLEIPDADLV